MRILIATPLYPPDVGGPSYYAKELAEVLQKKGHTIEVSTFGPLLKLPMGIRNIAFGFSIVAKILWSDLTIALDTFSVAVPSVFLSRLFGKKIYVRTGGDFLWEQYLERTHHAIPLKDFYAQHYPFTHKEKVMYWLTQYVIRHSVMIFSTAMQRDIWCAEYKIPKVATNIIENAFGSPMESAPATEKRFMWNVRPIQMKNPSRVRPAFAQVQKKHPEIILDDGIYPKKELIERMKKCYAVMLPSLTEISPNLLIDAARMHKPFIIDKYSGLIDILGKYGTVVDPLDEADIARGIESLMSEEGYKAACARVKAFSYERSYDDVADDFLKLL